MHIFYSFDPYEPESFAIFRPFGWDKHVNYQSILIEASPHVEELPLLRKVWEVEARRNSIKELLLLMKSFGLLCPNLTWVPPCAFSLPLLVCLPVLIPASAFLASSCSLLSLYSLSFLYQMTIHLKWNSEMFSWFNVFNTYLMCNPPDYEAVKHMISLFFVLIFVSGLGCLASIKKREITSSLPYKEKRQYILFRRGVV